MEQDQASYGSPFDYNSDGAFQRYQKLQTNTDRAFFLAYLYRHFRTTFAKIVYTLAAQRDRTLLDVLATPLPDHPFTPLQVLDLPIEPQGEPIQQTLKVRQDLLDQLTPTSLEDLQNFAPSDFSVTAKIERLSWVGTNHQHEHEKPDAPAKYPLAAQADPQPNKPDLMHGLDLGQPPDLGVPFQKHLDRLTHNALRVPVEPKSWIPAELAVIATPKDLDFFINSPVVHKLDGTLELPPISKKILVFDKRKDKTIPPLVALFFAGKKHLLAEYIAQELNNRSPKIAQASEKMREEIKKGLDSFLATQAEQATQDPQPNPTAQPNPPKPADQDADPQAADQDPE